MAKILACFASTPDILTLYLNTSGLSPACSRLLTSVTENAFFLGPQLKRLQALPPPLPSSGLLQGLTAYSRCGCFPLKFEQNDPSSFRVCFKVLTNNTRKPQKGTPTPSHANYLNSFREQLQKISKLSSTPKVHLHCADSPPPAPRQPNRATPVVGA